MHYEAGERARGLVVAQLLDLVALEVVELDRGLGHLLGVEAYRVATGRACVVDLEPLHDEVVPAVESDCGGELRHGCGAPRGRVVQHTLVALGDGIFMTR